MHFMLLPFTILTRLYRTLVLIVVHRSQDYTGFMSLITPISFPFSFSSWFICKSCKSSMNVSIN